MGATRGCAKSGTAEAVVPAEGGDEMLSAESERTCGAAEWPLRHCVVVQGKACASCCYYSVSAWPFRRSREAFARRDADLPKSNGAVSLTQQA